MAIDAQLGRIGKVGAELDEKGPELFIQTVEIVEIHIGAAVVDPGNVAAIAEVLAPRSWHTRLLLRHADEDHPFLMLLLSENT